MSDGTFFCWSEYRDFLLRTPQVHGLNLVPSHTFVVVFSHSKKTFALVLYNTTALLHARTSRALGTAGSDKQILAPLLQVIYFETWLWKEVFVYTLRCLHSTGMPTDTVHTIVTYGHSSSQRKTTACGLLTSWGGADSLARRTDPLTRVIKFYVTFRLLQQVSRFPELSLENLHVKPFGPGNGHLNSSTSFMQNVNILRTKKDNFMKYTTFCRGINWDCLASLKKI